MIYGILMFLGKSMHEAHASIIIKNGWKYVLSR